MERGVLLSATVSGSAGVGATPNIMPAQLAVGLRRRWLQPEACAACTAGVRNAFDVAECGGLVSRQRHDNSPVGLSGLAFPLDVRAVGGVLFVESAWRRARVCARACDLWVRVCSGTDCAVVLCCVGVGARRPETGRWGHGRVGSKLVASVGVAGRGRALCICVVVSSRACLRVWGGAGDVPEKSSGEDGWASVHRAGCVFRGVRAPKPGPRRLGSALAGASVGLGDAAVSCGRGNGAPSRFGGRWGVGVAGRGLPHRGGPNGTGRRSMLRLGDLEEGRNKWDAVDLAWGCGGGGVVSVGRGVLLRSG